MSMLISMVVAAVLILALAVMYFKTIKAIELDDIKEAMARAQRVKNKRLSNSLASD